MNETLEFVVRHGPALLFAAVFVEQMGIPLPATPWLLTAGALSTAGKMNSAVAIVAATSGSVIADLIWFYLGRYGGNRALNFLCRISLEPDSCVRRTQDLFTRYGMRGIIVAKFIPGLSTLVPPLAGNSGLRVSRFVFFDGLASLLYSGSFVLIGVLLGDQLEQIVTGLGSLGGGALVIVVGLISVYIGYKFFRRYRLLKDLKMARITVDELHQKLAAGQSPIILDLRSLAELEQNPLLIPGALHMTMDELQRRHNDIPRDQDIILYCSCPNEVTSARMALLLHRNGILRVRPLLGGIDAWRQRNYPTEPSRSESAGDPVTISPK
jgi:membrane protein DedA with SNARE-associated domain/rhodanese-related sulfurtransferase